MKKVRFEREVKISCKLWVDMPCKENFGSQSLLKTFIELYLNIYFSFKFVGRAVDVLVLKSTGVALQMQEFFKLKFI